MIRRRALAALLLLAAAPLAGPAFAHPYSTSITQMDWNAAAARYEVALRLLPDQLEAALAPKLGEKPAADALDAAILAWLRANVRLTAATGDGAAGREAELRWIGKEVDVDGIWLYFELIPPAGQGPEGLEITNTLLFAARPHQLNTVRVRIGERQHAWVLRDDRPSVTIRLPPE